MASKKKASRSKSASAPKSESPDRKNPDDVGRRFARTTAPRELDDDRKRARWGLPPLDQPNRLGPYIIELNVQHVGGIPGAANAFEELYHRTLESGKARRATGTSPRRELARIAKSYYRCDLSDNEWRSLIAADERNEMRNRAVYRLWPDFPVSAQTDRSTVTIKADAALRSFDAAGGGITWAVVDSGIQATHPHFGGLATEAQRDRHTLWALSVRDLHRSFVDRYERVGGVEINRGPIEDPDWNASISRAKREELIKAHREAALTDDFGHGTHVAGIIAGEAPAEAARSKILERQFTVAADGMKLGQSFADRTVAAGSSIRGMAPRARLVSLRVLDEKGAGRASQVIQALEYIRERINDNPKMLRVQGVNLSVGYEFDAEMFACGQSPLCTAVDRLVQEGVVVVTAAGNTGYGSVAADVGASKVGLSNTINDPGNAAFAITVGSTHRDSPHMYGVSYFSSKGPTGDGRLKPDLVAPGERITSCAAGEKLKEAVGDVQPEKSVAYYVDDSGTSMAAPHVSGAIAAFLSIRREFIGRPLEVKRIFLESATPLNRERYFEGHGLIDLMRAIQLV